MSIVKFFNAKNSRIGSLRECIKYISNAKKTTIELMGGLGVEINSVYDDMMLIKRLYRKQNGRQHIHFMCSYESENTIELSIIKMIAEEIARYFINGFQVNWATHINTDHHHTHFIINTVNVYTGLKFSQSRNDLKKFKDYVNRIFLNHSLDLIDEIEIVENDNDFYDGDDYIVDYDEDGYEYDDELADYYMQLTTNVIIKPQPMVSFEMVSFDEDELVVSDSQLLKQQPMVVFF